MVGIAKSSFIIIISRQGAKIGQNECYRAVPRSFRKVSSRRNVSPTRSRRRKVEIFRQESCSRRDLKLSLERRHNDRILCSTMFLFFFLVSTTSSDVYLLYSRLGTLLSCGRPNALF